MFSYSKTGPARVRVDIKNYSSNFQLPAVTWSEEIDYNGKYKERKKATESQKLTICRREECEYAVHFWNCRRK